jgi:ribosomal-protein-serine acetyltransferase
VDDVRNFITQAIEQMESNQGPTAGVWADGRLVGCIGCHPIDWPNRNCSIGYWLAADYVGRGLMTRCCAVLLEYLFGELGLHRVEIRCGTGNRRSRAIPERLGFTREGIARHGQWVNDRWLDLDIWSLLEDEWRARRGT